MVEEKFNIKRTSIKGEYFTILNAMKEFSGEEIINIFDEWLSTPQEPEVLVHLNRALSNTQINNYKIKNHPILLAVLYVQAQAVVRPCLFICRV